MAQRTVRRVLLLGPPILLGLLIIAAGIVWLSVDPDAYKDRIAAAVQRQTGRQLTLTGALRLTLAPSPTLSIDGAALANLPGGSRPQMITAQRVTAALAWLPLLQRRFVITRLTLEKPDVLLEQAAQGPPNWRLEQVLPPGSHPAAAPPQPTPPQPAPAAPRPPSVVIQAIRLIDGTVTWHDARSVPNRALTFGVRQLDLAETSPDAPITLAADATFNAAPIRISGRFGSLTRLRDVRATDPWPAQIAARAEQASLDLDGSFTNPRRLRGYDLTVKATVADLALVQPLMPTLPLPAAHDLRLSAHVAAGTPIPKLSQLVLHAGDSDLGPLLPGVTTTAIDIDAPALDQPFHAAIAGSYAGSPLTLDLTGGAPGSLLPGAAPASFPIDLSAAAAGATLVLHGQMAQPRTLAGLQAKLSARIPDLSAFDQLARRKLPAWRDIAFSGTVADRNGLRSGIALDDAELSLKGGDLAGSVTLDFGAVPTIDGRLTGKHVDADVLRAEWPAEPTAAAPGPAPPKRPAPAPATSRTVIPDTPFALQALHAADADLRLDLGELVWGQTSYRAVAGHLRLQDGHLQLDPASATLPAGAAAGALEIDARKSPAEVALTLHAPGLAVAPLASELRLPSDVSGSLQVMAELHGRGDTPHQVAADVSGKLGLSMVGGVVDGRLLSETFGALLRAVRLPGESTGAGRSEIRCFALRLDADHGIAAIGAFALDVNRLRITGAGTIDLGRETLALRLRPFVKVAETGVVVPVRVGGTFRRPEPSVEPTAAPEAVASLAANLAREGSKLTPITSAVAAAGEKLLGEADTGNCAPALAAARDGQPGPEPAPLKPPAENKSIGNFLQRLFR